MHAERFRVDKMRAILAIIDVTHESVSAGSNPVPHKL